MIVKGHKKNVGVMETFCTLIRLSLLGNIYLSNFTEPYILNECLYLCKLYIDKIDFKTNRQTKVNWKL